MNGKHDSKDELENLANLVVDMYDLMNFYRLANINNYVLELSRFQKTEKRIEEAYPKFKDIKSVGGVYFHLCLVAKEFYEKSKYAKKIRKWGFEGFTLPEFLNYYGTKK